MTRELSRDMTYAAIRAVRWSRDLEQYSQEFEREVQRLHSLDKQVINNRSILEHLQAQLATSFADHCRIARQLDILEAHQIEMDNVLKTLSIDLKTAQSVFVSTSNERELLFTFGEDVSSKVQAVTQMFLQSESYPKQSNETRATTLGPMFHMLQLHLRELQSLEQELNVLSRKI
mmetsp:Transcript_5367/g.20936  ORF Transcript_5367/g.20936 Transcript_5367/m.20936 type:complete len:175 (-) Transcript_5367:3487-4011(-)